MLSQPSVVRIRWFNTPQQLYLVCYYSASCHFEAVGREIPRAQQVIAAWLNKIYGQSPPFTSYLWRKSKVWGISPLGRNDMPEKLL
jgi:hypothetical protein